ncbi:hypothetical protein M2277_004438 [Paenibacillus sp. LBL]|nr:hypothetical protein [Paenibacillus sp. LBL]
MEQGEAIDGSWRDQRLLLFLLSSIITIKSKYSFTGIFLMWYIEFKKSNTPLYP